MKHFVKVFICILIILNITIPISVHAEGGFVAIKGQDTYHTTYCSLTDGCHLQELIWFDTRSKAEAAGLKPCAECHSNESVDFRYGDFEPIWKTDDHLIYSALEEQDCLAYDEGHDIGYEEGFEEGKLDAEFYSIPQNDADNIAEDNYEAGHNLGYDKGYENGYDDGHYNAETELLKEYEKKLQNEKSISRKDGILLGVLLSIPVYILLHIFTNKAKK